ncbi:MAG: Hsp20/alpha crystallin family protein [Phycisphaerales bacterium]|nr:Hsp20/alpha crystallin family protein [Phycisphaerales bacterium]
MTNTSNLDRCQTGQVAVRRPGTMQARSEWTYRPHVDIIDADAAIEVYADLPGATGESIDVSFEQGILTIEARVQPRARESWHRVVNEFGVGNFHRRFQIDAPVDADHVVADYNEGVLKVTLPKAREAQRRRIPVKA